MNAAAGGNISGKDPDEVLARHDRGHGAKSTRMDGRSRWPKARPPQG